MSRFLLALVSLSQWGRLPAGTHAAVATPRLNLDKESSNRSLKFVNIIRDDLRRNNDDYVMYEQPSQAPPAPPARPAPPRPHRNPLVPPLRSAALNAQPSSNQPRPLPNQSRPKLSQSRLLPVQSGQHRRQFKPISQQINDPNAKSYTHSSQHKYLRINKLKGLLDDNKRWREASPPSETKPPTAPTTARPPPPPPTPAPSATPPPSRPSANRTTSSPSLTPKPSPSLTPATRPPTTPRPLRQQPEEDGQVQQPEEDGQLQQPGEDGQLQQPGEDGELQQPVMRHGMSPSPDEIDMAPAQGSQIARIRFKGRLCQRSILNMEGPSYDKYGKEVHPAHQPSNYHGRRFYQTRPPRLVLPRCCNCCKKSVLGCQ